MFSGIVQYLEPVLKLQTKAGNVLVTIKKPKTLKCKIGDSVCIDGVCSTVIKKVADSFQVEYMPETLTRTTFFNLKEKQKVNLETSLKLNDIISGHLVSGHVDCAGQIKNITKNIITISYPLKFSRYIIEKGSIAINGISLTCYDLKQNIFKISLIPHSLKNTNLQYLKKGDKVNLEFDLIGKYVQRLSGNKN